MLKIIFVSAVAWCFFWVLAFAISTYIFEENSCKNYKIGAFADLCENVLLKSLIVFLIAFVIFVIIAGILTF